MAIIMLVTTLLSMALLCEEATAAAYVRPPARPNLMLFAGGKKSIQPDQVHVSLAGPNRMRVSWMTSSMTAPSTVHYGTTSQQYTAIASGVKKSYSYFLYKSGQMHHVVVGPLLDNTTYYYMCGGSGREFKFTTPPPAGPDVPIKFAVVGDLGQTGWTKSTLEHIENSNYNVLLLAGDLSYADYYQPLWDSFGKLVTPYASAKPWMVTLGNHDIEGIPYIVDPFRAYNTRWQMPYSESGSVSNQFYSFETAGVHVLMLASYADFDEDSSQYKWLQADLARVDRSRTPWLIAVLHAPWYNSNAAHQLNGDRMMAAMESLLYEARVDMVFAGHVHAYERMTRVYSMKRDPCGIIHITIGDGGNREGLAQSFLDEQPEWSMYREASFGHGELDMVNATHARWTWHRNDDDEAVVADDIWITSLSAPESQCSVSSSTKRGVSNRRVLRPLGT
ncbi:unnamed protein product [Sphagnum troendelagicum]|uniref:Purple acid phosphatase n=1 Tax=Sphagnum troendelagicum TaxID=128251 RepID=A0ABP0V6K9_9BRYO